MVGTLVRLQLKLTWRSLGASTGRKVLAIMMICWLGFFGMQLAFGLSFMRGMPNTLGSITVIGFALLMVIWPIAALMFTGGNDLSDAGQFALFPVSAAQLLPGLLIAGLVDIVTVFVILLGVGFIIAWSSGVLTLVSALVAFILGLSICLLTIRALSAALSVVLQSRQFKKIAAIVMFLVFMGFMIGFQMLMGGLGSSARRGGVTFAIRNPDLSMLGSIADVVAWTPFGWAWALPWNVYRGEWVLGAIRLVLCVALIWVLARAWRVFLARDLVSPLTASGKGQLIKAKGRLDSVFRSDPVGAVTSRLVRYWRRDTRRLMQLVSSVISPLLIFIIIQGIPVDTRSTVITFFPIIFCLALGSFSAADISYDGSAIWMQISAGVSGREDRLARALALLILFGPLFLTVFVGSAIWTQRWQLLPGVFGASVALIGIGIGVGSWVGGVWQFAMPPATARNIFKSSGGANVESFVGSMVAFFVPTILGGIVTIGAVVAIWIPWVTWLTFGVGILMGVSIMALGIIQGGKCLDQRWPEALAKVTWTGK